MFQKVPLGENFMGSESRYNPLLDSFKEALAVNEHLSLNEQFEYCDSFLCDLEERADENERENRGGMSRSNVMEMLVSSFNHYPRNIAKEMFIGKIVSGINSSNDFIECLCVLQRKFPNSPRISSLIDKMTRNMRHLETLIDMIESY
jgi:hypothetical protein